MQLISLRNGIKPLTIATGLLISSASPIYADIDQYSNIVSVITNHRTNKYIQETDNVEDAFIVSKRKFYSFYDSWKNKTFLLSSVIDIIEQSDFKAIIAMGYSAVPFIIEEIEKEPSNLVWALNLIYNQKISKNPNITIKDACKLWIKALRN